MKKKYKRAGTTSERQDYRKGGRVGYVPGGQVYGGEPGGTLAEERDEFEENYQGNQDNQDNQDNQTQDSTQGENVTLTPEQEAANRASLQQAAAGQVPQAAVIPEAVKVGIDPKTGQPIPEETATTMAAPTQVGITQAAPTPQEQVTTAATPAVVPTPTVAPVSTVEATQVTEAPTVEAAQTAMSEDALAKTAGVERIPTIEAAEINVEEGAVAQRVVGQISPQAIATAAKASGTTLARVTRAKKQLRNAGLDEATITELGDDPEALEDRLTDFTEAQRGVIEGLPEEALVSNQMDTLLKGIENGEIPTWARPAVDAVESMLAARGLSASSVGRDALINTIIQSAVPLAQANAQAIQQSVAQEKTLIAQEALANAQLQQQTALTNANNVFRLDLAQFNADQQTELSNSKFLQTVSITNATLEQQ
jgi:hypothetical protein